MDPIPPPSFYSTQEEGEQETRPAPPEDQPISNLNGFPSAASHPDPQTKKKDGPSSSAITTAASASTEAHQHLHPPSSPIEPHKYPLQEYRAAQNSSIVEHWNGAPTFSSDSLRRSQEENLEEEDSLFADSKETMADTTLKEGDAAAYTWNGDKKGGTVSEVAHSGSVTMDTARGNTVEKKAGENDPAVRLERSGHDVVKNQSELTKEGEGDWRNESGIQNETHIPPTGEKRGAEDGGEEGEGKKQKTETNGEKKKKGRPAKNGAGDKIGQVKEKVKKRLPKKAATESGEPRRSGRNAGK